MFARQNFFILSFYMLEKNNAFLWEMLHSYAIVLLARVLHFPEKHGIRLLFLRVEASIASKSFEINYFTMLLHLITKPLHSLKKLCIHLQYFCNIYSGRKKSLQCFWVLAFPLGHSTFVSECKSFVNKCSIETNYISMVLHPLRNFALIC